MIPLRILLLCLLSLLILASLTVPAFAGSYTTIPQTESGNVIVKVNSTKLTTYKIDIAWGDMNFTYNFGTLVWDVNTHTYSAPNPTGWDKTSSNITITNHSNAAVKVTPSMTAVNNVAGVTASLSNTSAFQLGSAEGGTATNGTVAVSVGGAPTSTTAQTITFKTVTIQISKP